MDFLRFDREIILPLSIALGALVGGLLGAWAGSGSGLIIFAVIFLPVVYVTGFTNWITR